MERHHAIYAWLLQKCTVSEYDVKQCEYCSIMRYHRLKRLSCRHYQAGATVVTVTAECSTVVALQTRQPHHDVITTVHVQDTTMICNDP